MELKRNLKLALPEEAADEAYTAAPERRVALAEGSGALGGGRRIGGVARYRIISPCGK
jgi:hypothetical protein